MSRAKLVKKALENLLKYGKASEKAKDTVKAPKPEAEPLDYSKLRKEYREKNMKKPNEPLDYKKLKDEMKGPEPEPLDYKKLRELMKKKNK